MSSEALRRCHASQFSVTSMLFWIPAVHRDDPHLLSHVSTYLDMWIHKLAGSVVGVVMRCTRSVRTFLAHAQPTCSGRCSAQVRGARAKTSPPASLLPMVESYNWRLALGSVQPSRTRPPYFDPSLPPFPALPLLLLLLIPYPIPSLFFIITTHIDKSPSPTLAQYSIRQSFFVLP